LPEAALSHALSGALLDSNWNVRREALSLVTLFLSQGAAASSGVASALVSNLGDAKVTIRKAAASALLAWLRASKSTEGAVAILADSGLRATDHRICLETVEFLRSAAVSLSLFLAALSLRVCVCVVLKSV
jgi:hypothetical protein